MKKNIIGWASAFLIVLAYFLLAGEYVESNDIMYNIINFIGGAGLAYRVWLDKNYSNFILEVIFVSIAIFKIIQYV